MGHELEFYVVEFEWFESFWNVIDKYRQQLLQPHSATMELPNLVTNKMCNGPLCSNATSSDRKLGPEKEYGHEYVLVGPLVWEYISKEFGHDGAIICFDTKLVTPVHSSNNDSWDVSVDSKYRIQTTRSRCTVHVPITGRFRYEDFLTKQPQQHQQHSDDSTIDDNLVRLLHFVPTVCCVLCYNFNFTHFQNASPFIPSFAI